jgi:hypothetical protein
MASFTPPTIGQPNSTEDQDIATALTVLDNLLDASDLVPNAGLAGSIALSKLASGTSAHIIVCNASGVPTYVPPSGDATISNTGVVSLAADSVGASEIAANSVGASEMADDAVGQEELTTALAEKLGVSESSTVRRGTSIITTEESRTNTAYDTLTTPDQVQDVVLPANGLIVVAYQALVKSSVNAAGSIALFIGSNQLKYRAPSLTLQSTGTVGTDAYAPISSAPQGLLVDTADSASDVTTGQAVASSGTAGYGGPCFIFAAAGTYTVSVQFKATSGSVTAKQRKLWVWTMAF